METSMLNNLPEDVLMDIFTRIPVKSLLQFKCVCKSWYAIIRDPIFITNVNQSTLTNNDYLAVTSLGTAAFSGKCFISLISYETLREVIKITVPSKEHGKKPLRIVDSCNCVLCLNVSKLGDTNFLFNLTTSELKELPKPHDIVLELDENIILSFIGLGFGHDPETNDYKLVRSSFSKKTIEQIYSRVDVYSLSTNSWRRKDMLVPGVVLENYFSKPIINGALHWSDVIMKKRVLCYIIISFGIEDEVSRYIKLPDIDFDGTKWNPFVRKNLLAIVICTRDRHTFNIWVMNEYGIKESWT